MWYWATRNAENEAEVESFKSKLWVPPKGTDTPTVGPWSAAEETSAFAAFKAATSG